MTNGDAAKQGGETPDESHTPDTRPEQSADEVSHLIGRLGHLLDPGRDALRSVQGGLGPAWRRATRGEYLPRSLPRHYCIQGVIPHRDVPRVRTGTRVAPATVWVPRT